MLIHFSHTSLAEMIFPQKILTLHFLSLLHLDGFVFAAPCPHSWPAIKPQTKYAVTTNSLLTGSELWTPAIRRALCYRSGSGQVPTLTFSRPLPRTITRTSPGFNRTKKFTVCKGRKTLHFWASPQPQPSTVFLHVWCLFSCRPLISLKPLKVMGRLQCSSMKKVVKVLLQPWKKRFFEITFFFHYSQTKSGSGPKDHLQWRTRYGSYLSVSPQGVAAFSETEPVHFVHNSHMVTRNNRKCCMSLFFWCHATYGGDAVRFPPCPQGYGRVASRT